MGRVSQGKQNVSRREIVPRHTARIRNDTGWRESHGREHEAEGALASTLAVVSEAL